MTFHFHPDAEQEFLQAIDYYEECKPGLGEEFSLEILAAINRILSHPGAWPEAGQDIRRCLANRFPYGIIYNVDSGGILILAVMHLHRRPDYWKTRATRPRKNP